MFGGFVFISPLRVLQNLLMIHAGLSYFFIGPRPPCRFPVAPVWMFCTAGFCYLGCIDAVFYSIVAPFSIRADGSLPVFFFWVSISKSFSRLVTLFIGIHVWFWLFGARRRFFSFLARRLF